MEYVLWVIGVVIAIVVAHAYYRLSISKSLSFFLLHDDQPLSKVDPNVRSRLVVQFFKPEAPPSTNDAFPLTGEAPSSQNATIVQALHHIQVLVANTGVRAISFTEAPTIEIPSGKLLLDASIIHQRPKDLGASLARLPVADDGVQRLRLAIPLLNRREFFIVKLLLSDVIAPLDIKVHLLAEDLDRTIGIRPLPANATKSVLEAFEWPAIWVGVLLIFCTTALLLVENAFYKLHPLPSILDVGITAYFSSLTAIHVELGLGFVGILAYGFIGIVLLFGIGLQSLTNWRRIVLPTEMRPR